MLSILAATAAALALIAIVLAYVQAFFVSRAVRRQPLVPTKTRGISILKPLCGVDDELEQNLEAFANLSWPVYEVLLGVRDTRDAAWPVAMRMARRYPQRFRVFVQQGEPGLNPKVNQLVTLERYARHGLLVISDSNVRVNPGYLSEIAALLENPEIGLVTHPTVGIGERKIGSLFDNLHMTAGIGAGMIAAKELAGQDLVVGKSMAFRREDLEALGGFASLKDVLAEDFVMGRRTSTELGLEVAIARQPIFNVSQDRRPTDFLARFKRWGVMQHAAVGPVVYLAQALLNPVPLALLALVLAPSWQTVLFAFAIAAARIGADSITTRLLRPGGFTFEQLLCVPAKDLVLFAAWLHGLVNDTVNWRGNELRVVEGTRLLPIDGPAVQPLELERPRAA